MRILSIDPHPWPGEGRLRNIAKFDVELTDSIRLYAMRLLQTAGGKHLVYAPSAGGKRCASFAPDLAIEITSAAVAALEDRKSNDNFTVA